MEFYISETFANVTTACGPLKTIAFNFIARFRQLLIQHTKVMVVSRKFPFYYFGTKWIMPIEKVACLQLFVARIASLRPQG